VSCRATLACQGSASTLPHPCLALDMHDPMDCPQSLRLHSLRALVWTQLQLSSMTTRVACSAHHAHRAGRLSGQSAISTSRIYRSQVCLLVASFRMSGWSNVARAHVAGVKAAWASGRARTLADPVRCGGRPSLGDRCTSRCTGNPNTATCIIFKVARGTQSPLEQCINPHGTRTEADREASAQRATR
jgi:hypothetical protein